MPGCENHDVPRRKKLMTKITNASLKLKIWKDTHGQDLMEYALMAGFLAAASGFTLPATGDQHFERAHDRDRHAGRLQWPRHRSRRLSERHFGTAKIKTCG